MVSSRDWETGQGGLSYRILKKDLLRGSSLPHSLLRIVNIKKTIKVLEAPSVHSFLSISARCFFLGNTGHCTGDSNPETSGTLTLLTLNPKLLKTTSQIPKPVARN